MGHARSDHDTGLRDACACVGCWRTRRDVCRFLSAYRFVRLVRPAFALRDRRNCATSVMAAHVPPVETCRGVSVCPDSCCAGCGRERASASDGHDLSSAFERARCEARLPGARIERDDFGPGVLDPDEPISGCPSFRFPASDDILVYHRGGPPPPARYPFRHLWGEWYEYLHY